METNEKWRELLEEQKLQTFLESINNELQRLYSGNKDVDHTEVVVYKHRYFEYDQTLFIIYIFFTDIGSCKFSFCMLNDTLYNDDAKSIVNRRKAIKQIKYYKNTILPYPRLLGIR